MPALMDKARISFSVKALLFGREAVPNLFPAVSSAFLGSHTRSVWELCCSSATITSNSREIRPVALPKRAVPLWVGESLGTNCWDSVKI